MSAQVAITQLPAAGAITGTEAVPIVQNGVTVQTTTAAISASPSQIYQYVTAIQTPALPNSRYLSGGTGIGLTVGSAQGPLTIALNGTAGSLEAAGDGIVVKASGTIVPRSIATSGNGIGVTNGSGVAGNPTIALSGLPAALASASGTGLLNVVSGTSIGSVSILGTADQIAVANGNASAGSPTISLASNPIVPGTAGMTIPKGTTAQQPSGVEGQFRFNTTTSAFYGFAAGSWRQFALAGGVTSFSAGSTGLTPSTGTSGAVVLGGTLNAASGGTGANTLTGYIVGNGTSPMTASATIPTTDLSGTISNAQLANSSITINGSSVSLGGSVTVTATATNALTISTGLSGTSYDGSAAVTIAIDSAVATLTGTQTLTNKTISGASNTLSNIGNASLTNSQITLGTTAIALGGTSLAPAGLTSVTVTQDPATALQLATKQYVDGLAATGLVYHAPVQAATTQSLAAQTGGTVTYNNGASGVGATITLSVALTVLDGYTLLNTNRILVKDEVNQAYNGVYTWATGGTVLTRSTDTDSYGTGTGDLSLNDYFFVQNGTVNKGSSYVCTTEGTIVFGTTAITFAQFSASQVYTATSPIDITGTVISLNTVPVASGGTNLTSYTTGDMLYASGATALSKLAIGTQGYVLTAGATGPTWSGISGGTF
jgi:hypothetical protein